MKAIHRAACLLLAAASLLALPVHATSFSTDQSDLWWNASESGWGIQLIQRGSVIFATMFVYGPSTTPAWYTATLNPQGGAGTWSGNLIASTGPAFGTVPFDPAAVGRTTVGTMTWAPQFVETGTLTYNVEGITVVKNVVRQNIAFEDYAGHYGGGIHQAATGCADAGSNGTTEAFGTLDVTQNGQALTLRSFPSGGGSCSYPGTLTQYGQMGGVSGVYSCSDGKAGTFALFEMQVNPSGITGRFSAMSTSPPGCQLNGWFGGLHVTTF